jgi:bacterioferritin-associated ferredoxin
MFVCLCTGVTSRVVDEVVGAGASTSKEIAAACGAGGECGPCRRTLRAIVAAHQEVRGRPADTQSRG